MPLAPYNGFIGPAYRSQSPTASADECVNLYLERNENQGAKSPMSLFSTPGLKLFAPAPLSPGRALFGQDDRAFAVIGFGFFEVHADGSLTKWGDVEANNDPATISSSGVAGNQLFITSGSSGFIFDLTTNVLSSAIPGLIADMGGYVDGFFVALDRKNNRLRISEYLDGLTWDVLQFRVRAAAGDAWNSMITTQHREILLIGTQTYEVWANNGGSPFPFGPITGVLYPEGTSAPFSVTGFAGNVAWLSSNLIGEGKVVMMGQYAPERISDHGVEFAIGSYIRAGIDVTDAIGMSYEEDGHIFYALKFPKANATWVYDKTIGAWHQRGFWDVKHGVLNSWRPTYHAAAFHKILMLDGQSGKIYRCGLDLFKDDEDDIRRWRTAPHLSSLGRRVRYSSLELDMQVGVGANGVEADRRQLAGVVPVAMMRISNDGAMTWGNRHDKPLGKMGKYLTRVRWTQLGLARDRVFEVSFSAPVPIRLNNAYLDARTGVR